MKQDLLREIMNFGDAVQELQDTALKTEGSADYRLGYVRMGQFAVQWAIQILTTAANEIEAERMKNLTPTPDSDSVKDYNN